jgi:radical SAM protein with 4Fe4S-binding SPASM domain
VDYAISKGGKVYVHAVFDVVRFPMSDVERFLGRWGDKRYGGHGVVVRMGDWADRIAVPWDVGMVQGNTCCFRAMSQLYVMYDGRVSTCCFDPLGRQVFGDLNTQTIREVYNSAAYVAFREAHSRNEADKYDICAKCSRI